MMLGGGLIVTGLARRYLVVPDILTVSASTATTRVNQNCRNGRGCEQSGVIGARIERFAE